MAAITRLGSSGHGTRRCGSFAGKAALIVGDAGEILEAAARQRYLAAAPRQRTLEADARSRIHYTRRTR